MGRQYWRLLPSWGLRCCPRLPGVDCSTFPNETKSGQYGMVGQLSSLRVFGIITGGGILLFGLLRYITGSGRRAEFFLSLFATAALVLVSVVPTVVDPIARFLTGDYEGVGRVVSVLILVDLAFFVLLLRGLASFQSQTRRLQELVRAVALEPVMRKPEEPGDPDLRRVMVVIPAYNEAVNIGAVLDSIPSEILGYSVERVVADDGSTDDTAGVARRHGAHVIRGSLNFGQGFALSLGYARAIHEDVDAVVTLDADGQHDPKEIEALIRPIDEDVADFVNGSRVLGRQAGGSRARRFGNAVLNLVTQAVLRRRITDCTSGFRAIRTPLLKLLDLKEPQFQSIEPLIQALRHGGRVIEVPITVSPRVAGESKKPANMAYGTRLLHAVIKAWWRSR